MPQMAIHFGAEMGEIDLKMDKPFLSRTKAGVQSLFFPGLPEKDRDRKNRSTPVREIVLHKTGKKPDFRDYRQNVHDPGKAVKDPLSGEHRSNATVHLHTGAGSGLHRTESLWYNLPRNHKRAALALFLESRCLARKMEIPSSFSKCNIRLFPSSSADGGAAGAHDPMNYVRDKMCIVRARLKWKREILQDEYIRCLCSFRQLR